MHHSRSSTPGQQNLINLPYKLFIVFDVKQDRQIGEGCNSSSNYNMHAVLWLLRSGLVI